MPHVVTQPCCADASCVLACPVNCIHPAPGEPGFGTAEMVFIDPAECVDCGACVTACPVGAIKPHDKLDGAEQRFIGLNADYFLANPHPDRTPLALVEKHASPPVDVRVAIVGAGPAGLYAADELLKYPGVTVEVYDRLLTPHGLVRAGVAPDHQHTKLIQNLFRSIEEEPGFSYHLGVEVGRDIKHAELAEAYHAVIYAVGAATDRTLGIPGEDLAGSVSATEFVAWYNGHPDQAGRTFDLSGERAVVIGNGNVALDVARVLMESPERLEKTDISDAALAALRAGSLRELVVVGRRGPADAAFTLPELIGLAGQDEIDVIVEGPVDVNSDKTALLAELAARPPRPDARRIVFRFNAAPTAIVGDESGRVTHIETAAGTIETSLVIRAIGYRARPVPDLPFDDSRAVVPNQGGRVEPGTYVTGWIKRGPNGFIGTNKTDSEETVRLLLDDAKAGRLIEPTRQPPALGALDRDGWLRIDAAEREAGRRVGRPRVKFLETEALRAAGEASTRRLSRSGSHPGR
ncbi:MAG TPA: FAD-dependent oxidoreductase [Aeromicrobium sp.]|nr:FAD-dependent oxidoreductase [Aeromicrobium sp.]